MATGLAQAIVESVGATGTTAVATYGSNTTAGNTLVAIVTYSAITGTVQVSDSLNGTGNLWTQIGIRQAQARTEAWFMYNGTLGGAKPTVTATLSASQNQAAILIAELTGSCAVDQSIFGNGTATTTPSSGSITTTQAGDFLFSYLMGGTSTTGTAGWTFAASISTNNRWYEYLTNQAIGTYNATYTGTSSAYVCCLVAFYQIPGVTQQASVAISAKATISALPSTRFPVVGGSNIPVGLSTLAVDSSGVLPAIAHLLTSAAVTASVRMRARPPAVISTGATVSPTAKIFAKASAQIGVGALVVPWAPSIFQAILHVAAGTGGQVVAYSTRLVTISDTIQAKATVSATSKVFHKAIAFHIAAGSSISATETSNAVLVVGSSRYAVGASGIAIDTSPVGFVTRISPRAILSIIANNLTSVKNSIGTSASVSATPTVLYSAKAAIAARASITALTFSNRPGTVILNAIASLFAKSTVIHQSTAGISGGASLFGFTNTTAILVVGSSRFGVGQSGIAVDQSPNGAIIFIAPHASIFAKGKHFAKAIGFAIAGKAQLTVVGSDVMVVSDSISAQASITAVAGRSQRISTTIHAGASITALGGVIGHSGATNLLAAISVYASVKMLARAKNFSVGAAATIVPSSSVIRGQIGCAIGSGMHISATPNSGVTGVLVVGTTRYPVGMGGAAVDTAGIGSVLRIGPHATINATVVLKGAQSVTINCYGTLSVLAMINRLISTSIGASASIFAKGKHFAKAIGFSIGAGASVTANILKVGASTTTISAKSSLTVTGKVFHKATLVIAAGASVSPSSGIKISARTSISCGTTITALSIIHGFAPATNIQSRATILTSVKILRRAKNFSIAAKSTISANATQAKALNVSIRSKASLSAGGLRTTILASLWPTISILAKSRVLRAATDNITCWGLPWAVPRVLRRATVSITGRMSMWDYLAIRYWTSSSIHAGSSITAKELILRGIIARISARSTVTTTIIRKAGATAGIFAQATILPRETSRAGIIARVVSGSSIIARARGLANGHATISTFATVNTWGLVARRTPVPIGSRATLSITARVIHGGKVAITGHTFVTPASMVVHKAQVSISGGASVHAFGRRNAPISSAINTSIHVSPTGLRAWMGGVSGTVTSIYPSSHISLMQAVISILPGYDLPPGSPPADSLAGIRSTITRFDPTANISIVDPTSKISVIPS